jgi:hypothetical protein
MNRTLKQLIECLLAVALVMTAALPALGASAGISASLEPSNIAVGEQAQLTVTITGGEGDEPVMPHVDGLEFSPAGQSSQYQSINGVVTSSTSQIYLVTPSRAGRFTIPPITIGQGSNARKSQSLSLQVSGAAAGARANAGQQPGASALPSPNVPDSDDDQAVSSNGKRAFLRLIAPEKQLHVGQLVPVQIKAYFAAGLQASVDGLPSLSSDAFTLSALDNKPQQTEEAIDGHTYEVLTWTTALSAVKAGDYSLTLQLPVAVTIEQKMKLPHGFPSDPFDDDSFFSNFFGNSVEKELTLTSEAFTQSVKPLPLANRPADFNGALGQFNVTAEASPDHVTAGDPITLKFTVSGQGNFDRVSTPVLANSSNWKTYKPVSRFTPDDSVGLAGTKIFEQAVVPLESGKVQIPSLQFSYFDPAANQYVTKSTAPIAVDVTPASAVAAATAITPLAPVAQADQPAFQANRVEPGTFTSTLRPVFLRIGFLSVFGFACAMVVLIFYILRLRARSAGDPNVARARNADRAIRDQLAAMDAAMQKSETVSFFVAARRALQQRLGLQWNLPPETITLSEINSRMNGKADGIRPVFQMADEVLYSHENLPANDLAGWKRILIEQLNNLEAR